MFHGSHAFLPFGGATWGRELEALSSGFSPRLLQDDVVELSFFNPQSFSGTHHCYYVDLPP
jgi:hypothetical protein